MCPRKLDTESIQRYNILIKYEMKERWYVWAKNKKEAMRIVKGKAEGQKQKLSQKRFNAKLYTHLDIEDRLTYGHRFITPKGLKLVLTRARLPHIRTGELCWFWQMYRVDNMTPYKNGFFCNTSDFVLKTLRRKFRYRIQVDIQPGD